MSQVEFEEEDVLPEPNRVQFIPTFAKLLIKWGIVKTPHQANIALVIIALVSFALSIFVFVNYVSF